jgi:hypothetical protein
MTMPRPSLRTIVAARPHRHRMAGFVRLRPPTPTTQLAMPKSPTLQQPQRSMRGTGEVGSTVNMIIAIRQPHQFGRPAPKENHKSP